MATTKVVRLCGSAVESTPRDSSQKNCHPDLAPDSPRFWKSKPAGVAGTPHVDTAPLVDGATVGFTTGNDGHSVLMPRNRVFVLQKKEQQELRNSLPAGKHRYG